MTVKQKLSELPAASLAISSHKCLVRIDDAPEKIEQTYLKIEGSPDGFRWLANHLEQMAKSTERDQIDNSNILAPWDFKNKPVKMAEWDSLEFGCKTNS